MFLHQLFTKATTTMIRAAFVSKFVVNLRKVSNRAHPSFLLVLHSVPPTHQPPQPQHCLLPDKEVNCNYQSLSLPRATHSPLFDTFLSPPPLFPSFVSSSLAPWARFLSPYRSATWKFHPPRNNFATTATTTQPSWPSSSTIKRIHVAR